MSIWSEAPRIQAPPSDPAALPAYVKDLANTTAKMAKDLEFILNGNIAFDNIRAESIETQNLKAGAVTAEKITVEELSAISANLGHITAGIIRGIKIYGSLISTSETQYPRVVLDPSSTAFGVYADENNGVKIPAFDGGISKIIFLENGNETTLYNSPTLGFAISGFSGVHISGTSITLDPISGFIRVPSWDKLYNQSTGRTLEQDLDGISSSLSSLSSAISGLSTRVSALEAP
jgi:hypothetical protein